MISDNQASFLNTSPDKFSEFFMRDDALRTLDWELSLTLNKRYKCAAGCRMCYLGDKWMSHEDFLPIAEYTENNLTPEWEQAFFKFSENFEVLSSIDDMKYLKDNFDTQYDFYKRNCDKFLLSSISDQSLFYHMPIIMNEMKFKDIYEISFSDSFLSHNHKRLVEMFKKIVKRYNIKHVKVIRNASNEKADDNKIEDFYKFLADHGIKNFNHHNVLGDYERVKDAAHAVYSEGTGPFSLLNQVTFMAFDDMYMELKNFTPKDNKFKVGSLWDVADDFSKVLPMLLQTKLDTYTHNALTLKEKDAHFVQYFEHCSRTFKVNKDFNYLPFILLKDYTTWYKRLIESGDWIELGPGLLRKGSTSPISLIEVASET